jgi:hypothetical protein
MKAEQIASRAAELIGGDRDKMHGDRRINFDNIARLWSAWFANKRSLSIYLHGSDVAELMALLKIGRMASGEYNVDDAIDGCGYIALAGELSAPIKKSCKHGTTMGHCVLCDGDDDMAVGR